MSEKIFLTDGSEILSQIRDLFKQAEIVKCAVAFWGHRAPFILRLRDLNKPIRIICNLESGATNPQVVRELLDIPKLEIRSHELLHAKVYWTEHGAVVGSSNASSNGLSFEGYETNSWIEANVIVSTPEVLTQIEDWFDELWKKSHPIDSSQLSAAEKLWRRRRNIRHIPGTKPGSSLLAALNNNCDSFKNLDIYIVIYRHNITEEANKAFQSWANQENIPLSSSLICPLENWIHLPSDTTAVIFYYGPKGGFRYAGFYYFPVQEPIKFKYAGGGQGHINISFRCDDFSGLVIKEDDEARFRAKIEQLYNSSKAIHDGDGRIISLYDAHSVLF